MGADFMIKNNNGKVPAEEAFDKHFFEISEFLVDKEVALKKTDNIIETSGNKVDAEDHIDLDNVNLNKLDENKEVSKEQITNKMDKLDIDKK